MFTPLNLRYNERLSANANFYIVKIVHVRALSKDELNKGYSAFLLEVISAMNTNK